VSAPTQDRDHSIEGLVCPRGCTVTGRKGSDRDVRFTPVETVRIRLRRTPGALAAADDTVDTRDPFAGTDFGRNDVAGENRARDDEVGATKLDRAAVCRFAEDLQAVRRAS
jgi:hypothetical protein